jgi:hypothetical protein
MKKLLLSLFFITAFVNAQSISIVTIPTEVKQGDTFNVTFEYTANKAGMYELQFIPLNSEGQPVWAQGNKAFLNGAISVSESATQVTVPITIPNDITLSADLSSPAVGWGLFGKITDGSIDVAYLSPYPTVNVVTSGGSTATPSGTITMVNIPTEVAKGATFDVTFEYTSNVTGVYELQFIPMNSEGQPVWALENKAFVSNAISINATATQVTVSITIPDDITLTADLANPAIAWGLFGKIANDSGDIAYLSPYPQVNVVGVSTTTPSGTISIVNFPSTVAKGSTFDVIFEYTSNVTGMYELQFIPMNSEGQPVWNLGNKAFVSDEISVNATATQVTVAITIPDDITLTADLTSPAVAWGLFGKTTDGNADVAYLSPYPQTNVVATLALRNNIFDSKTIFYNSSHKTLEINIEKIDAKSLEIYDVTGKNVMNIKNATINSSIDVSSLSSGIYIVRSKLKHFKFIK